MSGASARAKRQLQRLSRELGLGERVFWHGFSFNIMGELQTGDIFLLASLREGLPQYAAGGDGGGTSAHRPQCGRRPRGYSRFAPQLGFAL